MTSFNDTGKKTYIAGGALGAFERVKFDGSGNVVQAGATDRSIGVTEYAVASGKPVSIILPTKPGTVRMIAGAALAVGASVFSAASGKVAGTAVGSFKEGVAMSASSADGDHIEVMYDQNETAA